MGRGEAVPASRLEPGFAPRLRHHDVAYLEALRWPAYAMWPDARLAYFNPAYAAQAPAGWGLGADVLGAAGVLRPTISRLHELALTRGDPVAFRYACPTPTHERVFELSLVPLDDARGLLAQHSLVVERGHGGVAPAIDPVYRSANGTITQCAHCRRTRRASEATWDVVPGYIAQPPPRTSHGICPTCVGHYFTPSLAAREPPRGV